MQTNNIEILPVGSGKASRNIAVNHQQGKEPGIFWLSGFKSDMSGTKAVELAQWAGDQGVACTRFDYSGHGLSDGEFVEGCLSDWLEESLAVFSQYCRGRTILVGSSMGGWLALLLVRALARNPGCHNAQISGLLLIAPAVDFSHELIWKHLTKDLKNQLEEKGHFLRPSAYSDDPYVVTKKLIDDGRRHLLMGSQMEVGCPVQVLQGTKDESVPLDHVMRMVELMPKDDVTVTLVRDGDHRLSSPEDIQRLKRLVAQMLDAHLPG
ncbi:MAG: alpha/beta hydrolase [Stappiaceae bacterium]